MKRATPVLLAILLGAFVTAIGMGMFLKLANDDRTRLGEEINRARDEVKAALADKERIASEANEKVEAANEEVKKAQEVLVRLEDEQRSLATATRLTKPSTRELRGWKAVTSIPLGISFMIPANMAIRQNDAMEINIASNANVNSETQMQVLRMPPNFRHTLSLERAYLIDDRLVLRFDVDEQEMHLEIRHAASSTHLILVRPDPAFGTDGVERLLRTMEFAD